jgi:DNA topoisomerase-1
VDVSFVYMASDLHNLIIVESPSKAKTLKRFLGDDYQIEASVGHVRDLPKSDLGVDVDNGFKPTYVASKDKSKVGLNPLSTSTPRSLLGRSRTCPTDASIW